jgi:hypothetical protein
MAAAQGGLAERMLAGAMLRVNSRPADRRQMPQYLTPKSFAAVDKPGRPLRPFC